MQAIECGTLYLCQTADCVGRNIFKIGRTIRKCESRFNDPDYKSRGGVAECYAQFRVDDSVGGETELIKEFREIFGGPVIGREYFEGDRLMMQSIFNSVTTRIINRTINKQLMSQRQNPITLSVSPPTQIEQSIEQKQIIGLEINLASPEMVALTIDNIKKHYQMRLEQLEDDAKLSHECNGKGIIIKGKKLEIKTLSFLDFKTIEALAKELRIPKQINFDKYFNEIEQYDPRYIYLSMLDNNQLGVICQYYDIEPAENANERIIQIKEKRGDPADYIRPDLLCIQKYLINCIGETIRVHPYTKEISPMENTTCLICGRKNVFISSSINHLLYNMG